MTESVYNFIEQFILNDGIHKNLFFLYIQTVCFEKEFKKKMQKILKWEHQHILLQHNFILLNSVMKKWKNKYSVYTVSVPAVHVNKI